MDCVSNGLENQRRVEKGFHLEVSTVVVAQSGVSLVHGHILPVEGVHGLLDIVDLGLQGVHADEVPADKERHEEHQLRYDFPGGGPEEGLDADGLVRLILRTATQQRLLQLQHAPGCRTGGGLALFFSGELRHLRPRFRETESRQIKFRARFV